MRLTGFFTGLLALALSASAASAANAQCPTEQACWDRVIAIENQPLASLPLAQKYQQLVLLRRQMEDCGLEKDSVYARILHRTALFRSMISTDWDQSIRDTRQAVAINMAGKKGSSLHFAATSYFNLGHYYQILLFYDQALYYFDSSLLISAKFPGQENLMMRARENTSNICDNKGDFQRAAEEATLGLQLANTRHDTSFMIIFLNQRAYAEMQQDLYDRAAADAATELYLSNRIGDNAGKAGTVITQTQIDIARSRAKNAFASFQLAIGYSLKSHDTVMVAEDYLDAGNFLVDKLHDYTEAKKCYTQAIKWSMAMGDLTITANAYNDLGSANFYQKNYLQAIYYYSEALAWLKIPADPDWLKNPGSNELNRFQNKQILLDLFGNKTECLLYLYRQTSKKDYLTACLHTALLTDTLISSMRHEQTGEQSKLYWRHQTREFFGNTLEACWLAGDPALSFYFMEKSRAVLLNDKLDELGASALLPAAEAAREQGLQIRMIQQQQALSRVNPDSPAYQTLQIKFLQVRDELDRYIKTLESKAPSYYQYKYADDVPPLDTFKHAMSANHQSFITYFIRDTVAYILSISGANTRLFRLPCRGIQDQLSGLLRICSNRQTLNNDYGSFASLSNRIYQVLFQPLQLPKGRVIVCPDNFLIPFEALCTDTNGKDFLLNDYTFDYVYSARYLLKPFSNPAGKGNFLGVAPASFAPYLHVPDLRQSETSIRSAAASFSSPELVTGSAANRRTFMEEAPNYTIVNVYSHARADTAGNEPLLFMSDSVIRLSELQLLRRPAAQLVVLSACQTNTGRNATGEGIYSLARGFASEGIPAVASTLWQADERSTYDITEQFLHNLALGMRKDEALQKAKLQFIRQDGNANKLPYYWANMVLTGNADAIRWSAHRTHRWIWWVSLGLIGMLFLLVLTMLTTLSRFTRPPENIRPPS